MTHAAQFLSSRKASSTAPVRDPGRPSPYAPTEESLGSLQRAAPAPRPAFSLSKFPIQRKLAIREPCDWLGERYRREWDANAAWASEWAPIQTKLDEVIASGSAAEQDAALARAKAFQARVETAHLSYNTSLALSRAAFPAIGAELTQLEAALASQGVASRAEVINDVAWMQGNGKVSGFEAWVRDMAPRAPDQVLDAVAEAQEARRLVAENAGVPGAMVEFVPRHRGGHGGAKSFDVHVTTKVGAATAVARRVEVFNVTEPIKTARDFEPGISHGASKIDLRSPPYPGATRESTVRVGWPPPDAPGFRIFDPDGGYYIPDRRNAGSPGATGDIANDLLKSLNGPFSQDVIDLSRVSIIDQNDNLVFSFVNNPTGGTNWTIAFRRSLR